MRVGPIKKVQLGLGAKKKDGLERKTVRMEIYLQEGVEYHGNRTEGLRERDLYEGKKGIVHAGKETWRLRC